MWMKILGAVLVTKGEKAGCQGGGLVNPDSGFPHLIPKHLSKGNPNLWK